MDCPLFFRIEQDKDALAFVPKLAQLQVTLAVGFIGNSGGGVCQPTFFFLGTFLAEILSISILASATLNPASVIVRSMLAI